MKDALLDYIFDNCDAAYISDLRQKMIFQEYADMIGADAYCRDAMASVNYAQQVLV